MELRLTPLAANLSRQSARAPGLLDNSHSSAVVSRKEIRAASRAFLARRASSTASSMLPPVPWAVPSRARMFTLASPSVLAISATAPGLFSTEIVNCLVFAIAGTSSCGERLYARVGKREALFDAGCGGVGGRRDSGPARQGLAPACYSWLPSTEAVASPQLCVSVACR